MFYSGLLEAVKSYSHLKTQSVLRLRAVRRLKWHRGNLGTPCSESLLFLHFTPLFCSLLQLSDSIRLNGRRLNLMISVWNHSCAYSACFGVSVRTTPSASCWNAMCEVINLITTAAEISDTDTCRKHPGLARIYGRASDNTPIFSKCVKCPLSQDLCNYGSKSVLNLYKSIKTHSRFKLNLT